MFVSLGIRMLVNVEALNMVESVGNVIRHRTVPMVIRGHRGEYIMRWVPALSGECLAHAYQSVLADLARRRGLPTCYWCSRNEFIKHFDLNFYKLTSSSIKYAREEEELVKQLDKGVKTLEDISRIEELIVRSCIVEDVGGFLVTQGPTKRTARFYTSYAIPTYDTVERGIVALDHQFMVRHAPEAELRRQGKAEIPPAQAPYYPQVGSALYAWIFNLDLDGIGVSSVTGKPIVEGSELKRRRETSLDALAEMLDNRLFGAKQSRFTPFIDLEVVIAAVSRGVKFSVSSPILPLKRLVAETVERAEKALGDLEDGSIRIIAWCREGQVKEAIEEASRGKASLIVSASIRDLVGEVKKEANL